MGLTGPSREIIYDPVEEPARELPAPAEEPERAPAEPLPQEEPVPA